ncbi:MAG: acyltransferase family protein [Rhizobiaceae bacterium]|nr:acyltransferase family protein [Rhizobiaceae bacterium]
MHDERATSHLKQISMSQRGSGRGDNQGQPSTAQVRRYDLDWLRIFAFAVLIFYHIGLFYTTWDWQLTSRYSSPAIEPVLGLINPWRLALLFFISGVALRFAIDKRTLQKFLPERFTRLLLPLAFGMVVICAPMVYVELLYLDEIEPGFLQFYRNYLGFGDLALVIPPWYHLWYVAYVLLYTVVVAACMPLRRLVGTYWAGPFFGWLGRGRAWRILIVPVVPFAVYALVLDPYFPTNLFLWGDWANIAHTFTFFLFGFMAAKDEEFWRAVDRSIASAVVLSAILGVMVMAAWLNEFSVASDMWMFSGFELLRVFYAWAVIVTLMGLARKFANRTSPRLVYLTAAIFPYYILHQSIIVTVAYWFTVHEVPLWMEAGAIFVATALGCALGYEIVRRFSSIRILFGLPPKQNRVASKPSGASGFGSRTV